MDVAIKCLEVQVLVLLCVVPVLTGGLKIYTDPNHVSNWKVNDENYYKAAPAGLCVRGPCLQSKCLEDKKYDALKKELGSDYIERILPITLEMDNWATHQLSSSVARIILHEIMGYNVSILYSTYTKHVYNRIAHGSSDLNLEVWVGGKQAQSDYFVREAGIISERDMGTLAMGSLFVPNYMITSSYREILSHFVGYKTSDLLSLFTRDGTVPDEVLRNPKNNNEYNCKGEASELWGPNRHCYSGKFFPPQCERNASNISTNCFELLHPSPNWMTGIYESLVVNFKWNFTVSYVGANANEIIRRHKLKIPQIFYWWVPDPLIANNPSTSIFLNTWSKQCEKKTKPDPWESRRNCGEKTQVLMKIMSNKLAKLEPDIQSFFALYSMSNENQDLMLKEFNKINVTHEAAACAWVQKNVATWKQWVSNKNAALKECPEGYSEQYTIKGGIRILVCFKCPPGIKYIVGHIVHSNIGFTKTKCQGSYNVGSDRPRKCNPCPNGAKCPGGSVLYAKKNYWRNEGVQFFVCNPPSNCCPNGGNCTRNSNITCALNRNASSPLCGECNSKYTTFIKSCAICDSINILPRVFLILGTCCCVLFFYHRVPGSSASFRIAIDYYQIAPILLGVESPRLSSTTNVLLMRFGDYFNSKRQCMFIGSPIFIAFSPYFVLVTVISMICLICTVHYCVAKRWTQYRFDINSYCNIFWKFVITTYGIIVNTGLDLLNCQEVGKETYVLRKFNGIKCSTKDAKYITASTISFIMILIATFIPLWMIYLVRRLRKSESKSLQNKYSGEEEKNISHNSTRSDKVLKDNLSEYKNYPLLNDPTVMSAHGQVFLCYREGVVTWFMAYFLLRRTVVIAVTILIKGPLKYAALNFILTAMLLTQIYYQPYIRPRDNLLHSALLLLLAMVATLKLAMEFSPPDHPSLPTLETHMLIFVFTPFPITIYELLSGIITPRLSQLTKHKKGLAINPSKKK